MRVIAVVLAAATLAAGAVAGWRPAGAGTGSAKGKAMPNGNKPAGAVASHDVTVSWAGSTFSSGGSVPGYKVRRYDLLGNLQTVGGACAGTVSGTSCVETAVPTGTWQYTVTPAAGTWLGGESAKSDVVTVTL